MEAFQSAAEIDPHDATILYNIGDAFLGLGQPEKAVEPLRQAVRLQHDYSLAHYDLSLAFIELKNYQEVNFLPLFVSNCFAPPPIQQTFLKAALHHEDIKKLSPHRECKR